MAGPPELDAAALELLGALEALEERRQRLGHVLRQGWLALAQARYSLGCHRVSSLQYGATMVPRVRVVPREEPGAPPRFEEVPGGHPQDPHPPPGGGDGLRQRRGPPGPGGAPPRPPPDPLAWFGVLVPPSLRQAQGSFAQGVSLAVELAQLQGAVLEATARYRRLLRPGDGGDTRPPGDSGDTRPPGDGGDTRPPGDTQPPGDSGDTRPPGDGGDTRPPGDTQPPGAGQSHGDGESAGDTAT